MTLWLVAFVVLSFVAAGCAMHADNRTQKARRQVVRMADGVAEVVAALQAEDNARLMRARVAIDNLVAPYYHTGLPPYRQSATLTEKCATCGRDLPMALSRHAETAPPPWERTK